MLVTSVSLSRNPLADISRAVLESGAIRLAICQKPYGVSIQQLHVVQIQDQVVILYFRLEQSLQLRHIFQLDPTT